MGGVNPTERRDGHRPRQEVADFFLEAWAIAVAQRPRQFAHLFNQPAERLVDAPRAVTGAVCGLDLVLELSKGHNTSEVRAGGVNPYESTWAARQDQRSD